MGESANVPQGANVMPLHLIWWSDHQPSSHVMITSKCLQSLIEWPSHKIMACSNWMLDEAMHTALDGAILENSRFVVYIAHSSRAGKT